MRRIHHPDAEAELLEAARFYEARLAGLGEQFLNEFDRAIARIEATPEAWQKVEDDLRRYVMHRFPYGIYYRVEGEELRILVIKHHSRHPEYWKYRLDE
jgi:plasmid stabilization system protein ParE